jgi:hypothetical protein
LRHWYLLREGFVKYIIISHLVPGTEAGLEGFKVFSKVGNPPGADATWAGVDGKTFVVVTDEPDLERALAYSPFFQDVTVIPVVPLDDAYVQALQTAHGHWGVNAQG